MVGHIAKVIGFVLVAWNTAYAEVTEEQALLSATAFRDIALKGYYSEPKLLLPFGEWSRSCIFEPTDGTEFHFTDFTSSIQVVKQSGRVQIYSTSTYTDPATGATNNKYSTYPTLPVLPQSTIINLAKQYLAAAGFSGDYTVKFVVIGEPTGYIGQDYYFVQMQPSKGAAIFDLNVELEIEPTTGTLLHFLHPLPMAEFPDSVTPAISIDSARGLMLSICSTQLGCNNPTEVEPVYLQATQPFRLSPDNDNPFDQVFFSPAELALGDQNKTILTYFGNFQCDTGRTLSFNVDAMTGELKCQWETGCYGASAGILHKQLGWNWGLGPISAMNGKKAEVAQNADIAEFKPSAIPKAGVKLFIHRGRMNVQIVFDAKSGLIWHEIGGKRRYGKPNASLVKALVEVASIEKPSKFRR